MRPMLLAAWIAAMLSMPPATALHVQPAASVLSRCRSVGETAIEPVGDHDGHAVSIGAYTCTIEGGPLDGGVVEGSVVYEWEAGSGVLLTGHGVARRPGAVYVSENTSGRVRLRVIDGKAGGLEGAGTGVYRLAAGAASALSGRRYAYVVRSTAPGRFVVETTLDPR